MGCKILNLVVTLTMPLSGTLTCPEANVDIAYNHTKFDDSSFSHSRDK